MPIYSFVNINDLFCGIEKAKAELHISVNQNLSECIFYFWMTAALGKIVTLDNLTE